MSDMQKIINKKIVMFLKKNYVMEFYSSVIEKYIEDKNNFCVCADLCRHTEFEGIEKRHAEKVINVGIAEQNLLGISAGLASNSNDAIVYTQTLASFLITRGYDILSQNICNDNLNVKLLGNTAGFGTGVAGISHWIVNDIGMMKCLPNLTILCPSDVFEVAKCVDYASKKKGPFYIRIPHKFIRKKNDVAGIIDDDGFYVHGKKSDNIIITYGYHVELCKELKLPNTLIVELYNANRFNEKKLFKLLSKAKSICFVEEHFVYSGVGETIARLILENQLDCKYKIFGIKDYPEKEGDYEYLLQQTGLDQDSLKKSVGAFLCKR